MAARLPLRKSWVCMAAGFIPLSTKTTSNLARHLREHYNGERIGVRGAGRAVRGPRSEVRGPRSEVRGPRSEVRGPRSEVRGPRSEVRGPRSEVRGPRREARGAKCAGARARLRPPVRFALLLLVCALGTMMCTLLAREAVSGEYRSIAALYRTAPDEAVSRVLHLPQAAHEKDIADAASVASDWPWDDLALAAMLETDAALTHLHYDETAGAPYVEAAERLLSRGLQTAPGQVAFVMRWYRGVAAVLRVNGALTLAQAIDRRRWDLTMRQPQFGRALDVLASGIASEYAGCV